MSLIRNCNCEDFPCCGHGIDINAEQDSHQEQLEADLAFGDEWGQVNEAPFYCEECGNDCDEEFCEDCQSDENTVEV